MSYREDADDRRARNGYRITAYDEDVDEADRYYQDRKESNPDVKNINRIRQNAERNR